MIKMCAVDKLRLVAANAVHRSCFGASGVLVGSELSEIINNKTARCVHKNENNRITSFCATCFYCFVVQVLLLGAFAKFRKATISFVVSVCPRGTTRLPLDGFS